MIPKLYQKDGTTLIGNLTNCIECLVEEERNGVFELTLQYPNTEAIASSLLYDNIIICDAGDILVEQKFRIYDTRRMMGNTIEIYARHISFDLAYDYIDSINITNQSCEYALNTIFRQSQFCTNFIGHSDIINAQNFKISNCNCLEAIAGKQGSIIDTYGTGAEVLRNNYDIYVYNKRGHDNEVSIEYAKNLTGFELEEDTTDLITRIIPFATYTPEGGSETRVQGAAVDSSYINNYSHPFIAEIDFSDKFEDKEEPTTTKLTTLAQKYFKQNKCDLPKQNWKIEFIPLSKCAGFETLEDDIALCDTVTIKDTRFNIDTKAKVIKTTYDVLRERYDSMELGEPRTTLGDIVNTGSEKGEQGPPGPQGPPGADGNIGDFPDSLPAKPVVSYKLYGFASIELSWTYERQVYYQYEVYASKTKDFTPNTFDIIHKGQTSSFLFQAKPNETWYFKVCGVNSYGNRTAFSDEVTVTTTKVDDLSNYFETAAIGQAVVRSLTADYMTAGILKGNWIDAKNLSVTDGNGIRTLDIDSAGNVSLNVQSLKISSNNVATSNDLEDNLTNAITQYYLSTSQTELTGGTWQDTAPTWAQGKYMWQRMKYTKYDGTVTYGTAVCIAGAKGDTGATGEKGQSLMSSTAQFYLSTSNTTQSGGSWKKTMPAVTEDKYMWTRFKLVWANPTATTYTTPVLEQVSEAVKSVTTRVKNVEQEVTADAIVNKVSATFTTKTEFNNLSIGGANLLKQTKDMSGCIFPSSTEWVIQPTANGFKKAYIDTTTDGWIEFSIPLYTEYNTLKTNLTISFDYYETTLGSLAFNFAAYTDTSRVKEMSNVIVVDSFNVIQTYGNWKTVSYTFNPASVRNQDGATQYRILFKKVSGKTGVIHIRHPKLEAGTKESDWTPAPEDVENAIGIVDGKFVNYSTTTEMNSAIEQKANGILSTVSKTYATQASLKDVDGKFANYSTTTEMNSAINQKASDITSTVSKTYTTKEEFNGMVIGGRNLIKHTKYLEDAYVNNEWGRQDTGTEGFKKLNIDTTTTGWVETSIPLYPAATTLTREVTISFEYKESAEGLLVYNFGAYSSGSRVAELTNWVVSSKFTSLGTRNGWKYACLTFIPNSLNSNTFDEYRVLFKKANGKTGRIQLRKMKLEMGTKATDWSEAPEDVENSISIVKQEADKISWLVKSGTSASNMQLTDRVFTLVSNNITLTASHINLHGYVTANENFKINTNGSIQAVNGKFSGTITGSTLATSPVDNKYVRVKTSDYAVVNNGKTVISMGLRSIGSGTEVETTTNTPAIYLGADGMNISGGTSYGGKTGRYYGRIVAYNNENYITDESNVLYNKPYLDINFNTKYDNTVTGNPAASQIKMAASGEMYLSPVSNLEVRTSFVDGVIGDGNREYLIAKFASANNTYYPSSIQVSAITNHRNGNGLILADRYYSSDGAGYGDGTFTSSYWTAVQIDTGTASDGGVLRYVRPLADNATYLGTANLRWKAIYAANGTVQTSDRRAKENISYITNVTNILADTNSSYSSDDIYNYIKEIPFATYNLIDDSDNNIGFILQDLIQINPDITQDLLLDDIVIEKDHENEDIPLMGYKQGNFLNMLGLALQKAIIKIEKLENRLDNM